MEERRNSPRKPVNVTIEYQIINPCGGEASSVNLGEGGLCVLVKHPIPINTLLNLRFGLPGDSGGPIETIAKVVWQKEVEGGYLIGLKFGT